MKWLQESVTSFFMSLPCRNGSPLPPYMILKNYLLHLRQYISHVSHVCSITVADRSRGEKELYKFGRQSFERDRMIDTGRTRINENLN